jgi:hypothetical protein
MERYTPTEATWGIRNRYHGHDIADYGRKGCAGVENRIPASPGRHDIAEDYDRKGCAGVGGGCSWAVFSSRSDEEAKKI